MIHTPWYNNPQIVEGELKNNLSHILHLFGTQGRLTFYFSISPYTLTFVIYSLLKFTLQVVRGLVHARGTNSTAHRPSATKQPGSSAPLPFMATWVTSGRLLSRSRPDIEST